MKRVNSADIARLAGVSRSTVSRVINNYPNVPDETRARVMKVIEENHYYPQLCGQLLNGGKSHTIGLFWLFRSHIAQDTLSSSYFMHIVDATTEHKYLVLSSVLDNLSDEENIQFVRRVFLEGRIDAGIFVGVNNDHPVLQALQNMGMIVGVFDYQQEGGTPKNCFTTNFAQDTGEQAADYLVSLGHTRIAELVGDLVHRSCQDRHDSFQRGMAKHGLVCPEKWQVHGGIAQRSGYEAMTQLLETCADDLPTAVFAANDAVAFGAYRAIKEKGLRIPEDISVIGVDGHINSAHVTPPLTTIAFDFRAMFSSLVGRVISAIEEKEEIPADDFVPGTLIERESCRRI